MKEENNITSQGDDMKSVPEKESDKKNNQFDIENTTESKDSTKTHDMQAKNQVFFFLISDLRKNQKQKDKGKKIKNSLNCQ
mgnify:CR=1 FL=1